jgi:fructose-1,6-bisphosphatase II / sedoheptulose-1,7-bisphosphatase
MQGRLVFRNDDEKGRAKRIGIKDLNRKYGLLDLAKGNVMFAATGVTSGTSGTMLQGIRRIPGGAP